MNANTIEPLSDCRPERGNHSLTPGRVQRRRLAGHPWQKYFLYQPSDCTEGAPVLVVVHGISRNARAQAQAFASLAERFGVVVVAPLFPRTRFPRYQQLGISRGAIYPRPDQALGQILQEVGRLTGARTGRIHLFGYSGGGQFAHRYAMAYPERVRAAAFGAPGWYTFPDNSESYPYGTRPHSTAGLLRFRRERYLRVPMAVFVGAEDDLRDDALKQTIRIDAQQGKTRIARGRRWIESMRTAAASLQLPTAYEFYALPGCGHSFEQCVETGQLGWRVFEFLFGRCLPSAERKPNRRRHLLFHVP